MPEFEWNGKEVIKAVDKAMDRTNKEVAKRIMRDARRILKQKAKTTTARGLLSQFDVRKSKFPDGGYIVGCQMKGNYRPPYHAPFVELGTPGNVKRIQNPEFNPMAKRRSGNWKLARVKRTPIPAMPFLRPAVHKNRAKANITYQKELDKL